ncbi:MAG: RsmE family RNA methyltransferase [bacterium]
MPQFFIKPENIINNEILITNLSDINHIVNILRSKKGDKLILVGAEHTIYETQISLIKSNLIETKIIDKYKSNRKLNANITLAQSILKAQKQDFVIQKATELGVKLIIPFISGNTVVKINLEKDFIQKLKRWQKIAHESSKQCQRANIPEINSIISIKELVELNGFDVKLACVERNAQLSIKSFLVENKQFQGMIPKILVVTGPEGGWKDEELELLKEKGFALVSLGNLILRAETAATAAIANIIYEYEL